MAELYNIARMDTATTGTGTITLGSAVTGFLSFAGAGVQNGETVTYGIEDGSAREIGRGVYTTSGTTLTRTVLKSTNSDNPISLSGTAEVFITAAAEDFEDRDGRGKHTIYVPAGAMITATTSGAASASLESSTNDVNYKVFDFDASADEHVHFNIAMPKNWNEGTITFQVWWSSTATDTDGVAWGLQAVALSDNEAIDTAWGTAIVVTDAAQSAAGEVYVTSESSAVTIAGTPAAGDLTFFRLFRDVSDAADTMAEDARLIGVKIFYTTDSGTDT